MPIKDDVRASGKTGGMEFAEQEAKDLDQPMTVTLPEERDKEVELTFTRMRTSWTGKNKVQMERIRDQVEGILENQFADAYEVMSDIYDIVREHEKNPDDTDKLDQYGLPVWRKNPSGSYVEIWSRLGINQRRDFLFKITTQIFDWSQRSTDLWAEAMYAKAIWTEKNALEYGKPMSGTIEDRTAWANVKSAQDKYFAVFTGYLSRKADAIVRSMELLSQRLKDTLDG